MSYYLQADYYLERTRSKPEAIVGPKGLPKGFKNVVVNVYCIAYQAGEVVMSETFQGTEFVARRRAQHRANKHSTMVRCWYYSWRDNALFDTVQWGRAFVTAPEGEKENG